MLEKQKYNKNEVFHSEVLPLIEKMKALCIEHDLPLALVIAYGHNDNDEHQLSVLAGGDPDRCPDSVALLMSLLNTDFMVFNGAMELLDKTLCRMRERIAV